MLGATLDDGGNFEVEDPDDPDHEFYDTEHNDYPHIGYWAVNYLSAIRTSVGDLMPPSYDYWVER